MYTQYNRKGVVCCAEAFLVDDKRGERADTILLTKPPVFLQSNTTMTLSGRLDRANNSIDVMHVIASSITVFFLTNASRVLFPYEYILGIGETRITPGIGLEFSLLLDNKNFGGGAQACRRDTLR